MSTLNKYLIKQSFIPFVLSVGVITTVLFLQFLMRAIDRFLGKGLDVVIILEYLYLNLAWIIALSVPMSLLISSVMTYGRMSQENEITALKSAGVNLFSIIKPALWFGSIVGFLLCLFNNFILPDMNYNARLLARDIYQKKPELTIEPGYFVDMIPQYTMIVKELDGNEFKDVKIFSKNTTSEQTTIYAERGSLESSGGIITVNLQNGEIHEIDLENYDHYRKIKFGTHQIIISIDDLLLNRTSEANRTDREMKVPAMIEKIQQNKERLELERQDRVYVEKAIEEKKRIEKERQDRVCFENAIEEEERIEKERQEKSRQKKKEPHQKRGKECEDCGCEIPVERVKKHPDFLRCVSCQELYEQHFPNSVKRKMKVEEGLVGSRDDHKDMRGKVFGDIRKRKDE